MNDNNINRVVVRHRGPQGRGIPAGGTDGQALIKSGSEPYRMEWRTVAFGMTVAGPVSSVNGNLAVFDGVTGKKIKDSGITLSGLATVAQLAAKVTAVEGKGLSSNDFTDAHKAKLDSLQETSGYRGTFDDLTALEAHTFEPAPGRGDYVLIGIEGVPLQQAFWDEANLEWTVIQDSVAMTGEEIAVELFNELDTDPDLGTGWSKDQCRVFTSAEKAMLAAHDALINSIPGVTVSGTYGSIEYFSLAGHAVAIASASDGSTNLVKISPSSTLTSLSVLFTNGGTNDGTLKYVGNVAKTFHVTAKVSTSGASSDVLVLGIARNGTLVTSSRLLTSQKSTGGHEASTLTALIQLSTNDELTAVVGNTTDTSGVTIHTLTIEAAPV